MPTKTKPNIHVVGPEGEGWGWGVCLKNIRSELRKAGRYSETPGEVVFMPIQDHDFNPVGNERGTKLNLAYTFFEFPLGLNASTNARKYDTVFCGSTWCLNRMQEKGITNGKVLIQGVDHSIFHPVQLPKNKRFTVFSGGKFEYRKGQDLVISAFREFLKCCPDARLVCSWHNPWPQLIGQMPPEQRTKLQWPSWSPDRTNQEEYFTQLLAMNGIPKDNFIVLPQCRQEHLAGFMQQTDCGLFPNRCEGGTNLVMMEYMACGKPVVTNYHTGHWDLFEDTGKPNSGWSTTPVETYSELISAVNCLFSTNYGLYQSSAKIDSAAIKNFTWANTAKTIIDAVDALSSPEPQPSAAA